MLKILMLVMSNLAWSGTLMPDRTNKHMSQLQKELIAAYNELVEVRNQQQIEAYKKLFNPHIFDELITMLSLCNNLDVITPKQRELIELFARPVTKVISHRNPTVVVRARPRHKPDPSIINEPYEPRDGVLQKIKETRSPNTFNGVGVDNAGNSDYDSDDSDASDTPPAPRKREKASDTVLDPLTTLFDRPGFFNRKGFCNITKMTEILQDYVCLKVFFHQWLESKEIITLSRLDEISASDKPADAMMIEAEKFNVSHITDPFIIFSIQSFYPSCDTFESLVSRGFFEFGVKDIYANPVMRALHSGIFLKMYLEYCHFQYGSPYFRIVKGLTFDFEAISTESAFFGKDWAEIYADPDKHNYSELKRERFIERGVLLYPLSSIELKRFIRPSGDVSRLNQGSYYITCNNSYMNLVIFNPHGMIPYQYEDHVWYAACKVVLEHLELCVLTENYGVGTDTGYLLINGYRLTGITFWDMFVRDVIKCYYRIKPRIRSVDPDEKKTPYQLPKEYDIQSFDRFAYSVLEPKYRKEIIAVDRHGNRKSFYVKFPKECMPEIVFAIDRKTPEALLKKAAKKKKLIRRLGDKNICMITASVLEPALTEEEIIKYKFDRSVIAKTIADAVAAQRAKDEAESHGVSSDGSHSSTPPDSREMQEEAESHGVSSDGSHSSTPPGHRGIK